MTTDSLIKSGFVTDTTAPQPLTEISIPKWRDRLRVHPAAEIFPLMSADELKALADDIKINGLHEPVTLTEGKDGQPVLLDGRNRLDALALLGEKFTLERPLMKMVPSSIDAVAHVVSANLHRRHLTTAERRELIATLLKATPTSSNLQIAKLTKTSDKTVAKERRKLEARSEIPNVVTRIDTKGRAQPPEKKPGVSESPPDKRQLPAAPARQRERPVIADTAATEPACINPIDDAWQQARSTQREEFIKARWMEILRVHNRLGGAAVSRDSSSTVRTDAAAPDARVMPTAEAKQGQP